MKQEIKGVGILPQATKERVFYSRKSFFTRNGLSFFKTSERFEDCFLTPKRHNTSMGKKTLFIVSTTLLVTTLRMAFWALPGLPDLERNILKRLANHASKESFDGSLHIHKAILDRHFKLHIEGITGRLKTRQGSLFHWE